MDKVCFPADARPDPDALWWLAFQGEDPIGYAGMDLVQRPDGLVGYMTRCGVLPEARGRGVQKRLLTARIRYAHRMACSRVVTYTVASNPASINSLIHRGFKAYTPPYLYAGDVCYWERKL